MVAINIPGNAVVQKFVGKKFSAKGFLLIIRCVLSEYDH